MKNLGKIMEIILAIMMPVAILMALFTYCWLALTVCETTDSVYTDIYVDDLGVTHIEYIVR
tara:strand:+ start:2588 stop:2770 length:183 start_codon:yes stop_codon:yes gene_type:complete